MDADERKREAVDPDPEAGRDAGGGELSAELPEPRQAAEVVDDPDRDRDRGAEQQPAVLVSAWRKASAGTRIPRKSASPPRRGTGSWLMRLPPGRSTIAEPPRHPSHRRRQQDDDDARDERSPEDVEVVGELVEDAEMRAARREARGQRTSPPRRVSLRGRRGLTYEAGVSARSVQRAVGLTSAAVAACVLLGGAPASAPSSTRLDLGAPYAPTEGIHEVGTAISCPTATSCAAVGYFEDTSDTQQALLMDRSGSPWTPSEATLPSGASTTAPDASFVSVSCYSAGNCVAAGGYTNSEPRLIPMLVSETDGTWGAAFDAPPLPGNPYVDATVGKISCSAEVCAAVGRATVMSSKGYIVFGFGDSWTSLLAPLPADAATHPHAELTDVSCTESTCEAVGDYIDNSGGTRGVILTYAGATWTASEAPLPGAAAASGQHAKVEVISCPAIGECAAAGDFTDSAGKQEALLLTETSGNWSAQKGKLPAGTPANPHPEFEALDCSQAGDCAAVGFDDADSHHNQVLPLAVAESGGVWQPAVNPDLPANAIALSTNRQQSALDTVSCPTSSYCEAGGFYTRADESNPALVVGLRASGWSAGMETHCQRMRIPAFRRRAFSGCRAPERPPARASAGTRARSGRWITSDPR